MCSRMFSLSSKHALSKRCSWHRKWQGDARHQIFISVILWLIEMESASLTTGEGRDHKNFQKFWAQTSSSHSQYKFWFQSTFFPISVIRKHILWNLKAHALIIPSRNSARPEGIPQNRPVGKVKTDRTIRECDRRSTHFGKVTGRFPVEYVLRTHVAVEFRVDEGALIFVSCLLNKKTWKGARVMWPSYPLKGVRQHFERCSRDLAKWC